MSDPTSDPCDNTCKPSQIHDIRQACRITSKIYSSIVHLSNSGDSHCRKMGFNNAALCATPA